MKRRIFSMALALCLCPSLVPTAHAWGGVSPRQETFFSEESGSDLVPYAEGDIPTPQEAYEIMTSFKANEKFQQGAEWTNEIEYRWKGGNNGGRLPEIGGGCMAFAYELSDAVFGNLLARKCTVFTCSDVKAGDILRTRNETHGIIVLQVSEAGVVIAEGNFNGKVNWGRSLAKADVENDYYLITRYPEGYNPSVDPDEPIEGAEGNFEGFSWKVTNDGTLTISGTGAMPEIDVNNPPWGNYTSRVLEIIIGSGVTSVAPNAFRGSGALGVSIPSSVESIGDSAFRSCTKLVSVTIPEGVKEIGGNAFRSCAALTSVTLPASVETVGDAAFWQCTELTEVVFKPGSAVVAMGNNMFSQCYNLAKVTLPLKIDHISTEMFTDCLLLTSLAIPEGAESIGERAFASCGKLTQIAVPNSVTVIQSAAFQSSGLTDIYFGGTEAEWNAVIKNADVPAFLSGVTVHYNDNEEIPGEPETPETPSIPSEHVHSWDAAWNSDSACHWHECTAEGCGVASNSEKSGYGAHSYDRWVVDKNASSSRDGSRHRTCTVCGYTQTESIPATGSDWDSSSNSSASSSNAVTTTTTRNPDGSITTTKVNSRTGTVKETTKNPDGSKTVVETKKDGTVTILETDRAGNKTETIAKPDGSSTVRVDQKDGSTAFVTIHASGEAEAEVRLSALAAGAAQRNGELAALPIPEIQAGRNMESAPTITVSTGSKDPVRVKIPIAAPTPGTVAVVVHTDGTESVIKTSVPTADGVAASLSDGATVKIVDNGKDFTDISPQYWAADAVCFVSARELLAGTAPATFTPESPMTRAMLMVVLARLDGVETAGGTTWYEKGMSWAVASGISDGNGPNQSITREQLITMLWRYAGSPAASGRLPGFTDAGQISGYAREALRWAVENGIISGFGDGQMKPQGHATRAQVAQILKNFVETQFYSQK